MKNIEEKILMADEEIKQLQNKRKNSSVNRNRKKEKREIKGYMKKEQSLKVSLQKDKKSLYNQILEVREEVAPAEKVKTCIEQLQEREKQLSQVKRNELEL